MRRTRDRLARCARELEAMRRTCAVLHGYRAELAYWLALFAVCSDVLRACVEFRELAAQAFLEAWEAEDSRAWLVRWRGGRSYGSRPPWRPSTWRAQAAVGEATARELEWFERVAEVAAEAARMRARVESSPRAVVFDDGSMF